MKTMIGKHLDGNTSNSIVFLLTKNCKKRRSFPSEKAAVNFMKKRYSKLTEEQVRKEFHFKPFKAKEAVKV